MTPGRRSLGDLVVLQRAPASIALLALVVACSWALASPVGASPDDDFHLSSIWCSTTAPEDTCIPQEDEGPPNRRRFVLVPAIVAEAPMKCFAFQPATSASCISDFDGDEFLLSQANDNGYPTGFYNVMGLLVGADPARAVFLMRIASFALVAALFAAALWAADVAVRRAFTIAMIGTSVPMAVWIFASTNPSGLMIGGVVAYSCSTISAARGPRGPRFAVNMVTAAVAALAALVSRPDAGIWLIVASLVTLIVTLPPVRPQDWRALLRGHVLLLGAVCVAGAYFVLTATSTDVARGGLNVAPDPRPLGQVLFRNITELPSLWAGSLGTREIGWFDTPMPAAVSVGMVGVFVALVWHGLGAPHRRKLVALLLIMSVLTVLPLFVLAADGSVVGEGVQPRYLFPMLPIIAAVALLGLHARERLRLSLSQLVLLGAAVSAANAVALHTNIRRYVWGLDTDGFNLDANTEWWWPRGPSPMTVWIAGSIAFAGLVAVLLRQVWSSASSDEGDGASATGTAAPGRHQDDEIQSPLTPQGNTSMAPVRLPRTSSSPA